VNRPGWLGKDQIGGVPSEPLPDRNPPAHWRLEAIYATARPHHLAASPDGSTVAFVLDLEGTSDIWTVSLPDGALSRITTDRGLAAYWEDTAPIWSPDGSLLAYNSDGSVCLVPALGGPARRLVSGSLGAWLDEQRLVVAVERDRCSRLAVIDIDDPWPAPLGPKDGDIGRPQVMPDGRLLATFFPKDDFSRSDIVLVDPDGEWATLVGHPDRRAGGQVVGKSQIAYTLEDGDRVGVFLSDLEGSQHHQLAGGDRDFSNLAWLEDDTGLVAIATSRGRADLVQVTLEGDVVALAAGGTWQSPVVTSNGIVAVHEAFDVPARIVLIPTPDGGERVVYDGAPRQVRSAPHAKMERVVITSSGDMEIEGFLFRPADITTPVPAVVYPHGGPTTHYGDEWDGNAQYFVDKGYAWLAINFRGSTSYGLEFERANHRDWGLGDVDDCIAAAHHLAGLDWVDPSRIAIYGASYGSYLALASLVRDDNPFACAAAKYGDCDILTSWAQGDREGIEDMERMMGHPSQNRQGYRAGSPIHRIGRISKPILVAHGERDARVHPKQSQVLVDALDQIGATYEYVTYPTEGHGLLRKEPQLHFYRRLERFLDWYLM
jgi:dipeptidyl aminopeptidase/acylaminoacyl peptidase